MGIWMAASQQHNVDKTTNHKQHYHFVISCLITVTLPFRENPVLVSCDRGEQLSNHGNDGTSFWWLDVLPDQTSSDLERAGSGKPLQWQLYSISIPYS